MKQPRELGLIPASGEGVHQREELHGLGERSPEKWVIFGKLLSKINWLLLSVSVVNRGQLK